jgi:NADPH:quinone reductase-like Zn-dependent oxidoreductase
VSPESFVISPSRSDDVQRLLIEALPARAPICRGIVHAWSVDQTTVERITATSIDEDQTRGCISIVHIVQAVASAEFPRSPRLWTVTRGAQSLPGDSSPVDVAQSMVWGLGKVIAIEHPELRCCRIDLGPSCSPDETSSLFEECWSDDREDQVVLRGSERYVARLVRHALDTPAPSAQTGSAVASAPLRRFPDGDEVEIRVRAAGLDARDLTHPGEGGSGTSPWTSDQWAGTVVHAGVRVTDLSPGDEVIALGRHPVAPFLNVKACAVARRPAALTCEEAAAVPRAFVTALHALKDLARVSRDERVLVHGAGGSVGFAAVQVAMSMGAHVLASASSARERELLSRLGVQHLFDADSMSFPSEVLAVTNAQGVDVVVNCAGGSAIAEHLAALAPWGRYVDAVYSQTGRSGSSRHPRSVTNISFHVVNMEQLERERPHRVRTLLQEVVSQFSAGVFSAPLVPAFDIGGTTEALHTLMTTDGPRLAALNMPQAEETAGNEPRPVFREDATYLITGGLGGLGLAVAERMVERGARHLVLGGRRAPSREAQEILARLREQGADVMVASIDVADGQQMRDLLSRVRATMPPLGGIIHAAGVLANDLLVKLDADRFRAVMPSKVTGAWHLHEATRDVPLDFFVLFSSLASLIGSPGQANYAAANAFLEGLATHRLSLGLPALSIGWGPWSEIGMAADAHNLARLGDLGMGMLAPGRALDLLERLIERSQGVIGAIAMHWPLWAKAFPIVAKAPFVSDLTAGAADAAGRQDGIVTASMLLALAPDDRQPHLEAAIHKVVCQSLRLDPADLRMDMPLSAVGLDSIVALELKSRIEAGLAVVLHTPSLLRGPTIHQLAGQLLEQMLSASPAASSAEAIAPGIEVAAPSHAPDAERLLGDFDRLSDADVESLLLSLSKEVS